MLKVSDLNNLFVAIAMVFWETIFVTDWKKTVFCDDSDDDDVDVDSDGVFAFNSLFYKFLFSSAALVT